MYLTDKGIISTLKFKKKNIIYINNSIKHLIFKLKIRKNDQRTSAILPSFNLEAVSLKVDRL